MSADKHNKPSRKKSRQPKATKPTKKELFSIWNDFLSWAKSNEQLKDVQAHFVDLGKKAKDFFKQNPQAKKTIEYLKKHQGVVAISLAVIIGVLVIGNKIFPLKRGVSVPERVIRADEFVVKRTPFDDTLTAMGLIRGVKSIDIGFQVGGLVEKINFREGQMVKEGEVIVELDDTDARLKVEYNQSKLKAAAKKVEVHEELYRLNSIIEAKLDEVKYEYESQLKELEFAKQEFIKTRLKAPVTGLLGPIEVEEGETVTPNTKVTSLYSVGTVYADLGVIERDISKVRLGQRVTIGVDAYPGYEKNGSIISISPVIEGKSRNFKVRVQMENNDPSKFFLPGMFARANIYVHSSRDAIVVPTRSVKDDTVYIIRRGRATPQKVKLGYQSYDYAEVISGLNPGEHIVAEVEGNLAGQPKVEVINTRSYKPSKE